MKSNIFIKAVFCIVMVAAMIGCNKKAFESEKELIISDASLLESNTS